MRWDKLNALRTFLIQTALFLTLVYLGHTLFLFEG